MDTEELRAGKHEIAHKEFADSEKRGDKYEEDL